MSPEVQREQNSSILGKDPAKTLGYMALAIIALGHGLEYRLPSLNKPIDVPGLDAKVVPGFVHNSGYDTHLRDSELIVSTPGQYRATLSHGDKVIGESNFKVTEDKPEIVALGGTPRGGVAGAFAAGPGWANFPGEFAVKIVKFDGNASQSYSAKF